MAGRIIVSPRPLSNLAEIRSFHLISPPTSYCVLSGPRSTERETCIGQALIWHSVKKNPDEFWYRKLNVTHNIYIFACHNSSGKVVCDGGVAWGVGNVVIYASAIKNKILLYRLDFFFRKSIIQGKILIRIYLEKQKSWFVKLIFDWRKIRENWFWDYLKCTTSLGSCSNRRSEFNALQTPFQAWLWSLETGLISCNELKMSNFRFP